MNLDNCPYCGSEKIHKFGEDKVKCENCKEVSIDRKTPADA